MKSENSKIKSRSKTIETTIERYRDRFERLGISKETLGWNKGKQNLRYGSLIEHIPNSISTLVDVGCGFADGLEYIREKIPNINYLGIDIVPEFIEHAKLRYPECRFHCDDFDEITFDFHVDAVIASGIFNHNTGSNYDDLTRFLRFAVRNNVRYLAFDLLSDNVDFRTSHNFYYDVGVVFNLLKSFSRRVRVCHAVQPFEFSVSIDLFDDFDPNTSKYLLD
jgi:hypothetical protein